MSDVKDTLKDMKDYRELGKVAERKDLTNRVIFEMYLRALLRGADALFLEFLGETPNRHSQAHKYFQNLYEQNKISDKYSKYKSNIREVMEEKSSVEYSSEYYSLRNLEEYKKKCNRFIDNAVIPILEEEGYDIEDL